MGSWYDDPGQRIVVERHLLDAFNKVPQPAGLNPMRAAYEEYRSLLQGYMNQHCPHRVEMVVIESGRELRILAIPPQAPGGSAERQEQVRKAREASERAMSDELHALFGVDRDAPVCAVKARPDTIIRTSEDQVYVSVPAALDALRRLLPRDDCTDRHAYFEGVNAAMAWLAKQERRG